jgi:hypothetical protein
MIGLFRIPLPAVEPLRSGAASQPGEAPPCRLPAGTLSRLSTWQRRLPTASGSDHRDRDKRLPGRTADLPPHANRPFTRIGVSSLRGVTGGGFGSRLFSFTRDGQACQHPPRNISNRFHDVPPPLSTQETGQCVIKPTTTFHKSTTTESMRP